MNLDKVKAIDKDLLDEYLQAQKLAYKYQDKAKKIKAKIKELLQEDKIQNIEKFGYHLDLRERLQPSETLVKVLAEKNLLHLVTVTSSIEKFEKIWEELGNPNASIKESYLRDSGNHTKYLYITKVEEK